MKRTYNTAYLLSFLITIFLFSCGDDEITKDDPTEEPSRQELIIGDWKLQNQKITSITYQGTEFFENQFKLIEDQFGVKIPEKIFSDSTVIAFKTDNSYTIYDPQVDESVPGNWSFNSEADTIQLTIEETATVNLPLDYDEASAVVEELTDKALTLLLVVDDIDFMDGNQYGGKIRLNFNKE